MKRRGSLLEPLETKKAKVAQLVEEEEEESEGLYLPNDVIFSIMTFVSFKDRDSCKFISKCVFVYLFLTFRTWLAVATSPDLCFSHLATCVLDDCYNRPQSFLNGYGRSWYTLRGLAGVVKY